MTFTSTLVICVLTLSAQEQPSSYDLRERYQLMLLQHHGFNLRQLKELGDADAVKAIARSYLSMGLKSALGQPDLHFFRGSILVAGMLKDHEAVPMLKTIMTDKQRIIISERGSAARAIAAIDLVRYSPDLLAAFENTGPDETYHRATLADILSDSTDWNILTKLETAGRAEQDSYARRHIAKAVAKMRQARERQQLK